MKRISKRKLLKQYEELCTEFSKHKNKFSSAEEILFFHMFMVLLLWKIYLQKERT